MLLELAPEQVWVKLSPLELVKELGLALVWELGQVLLEQQLVRVDAPLKRLEL